MKAQRFVQELEALSPSYEELLKQGFPESYCSEVLGLFRFVRRQRRLDCQKDDAVLNLIAEYDTTTVDIGGVQFRNEIAEVGDKFIVGRFEADVIILDMRTKALYVLEWGTENSVIARAAKDSERFLDALILLRVSITECASLSKHRDQDWLDARARMCAEAAGGDEYLPLYHMIL